MMDAGNSSHHLLEIQKNIEEALDYLSKFSKIIESHMNDFITKDVWENTKQEREMLSEDSTEKFTKCCYHYNRSDGECHRFCQRRRRDKIIKDNKMNTFLSLKKEHEINNLSDVIREIVDYRSTTKIIDFGSGKGYLGQHLTATFQYNVLGVEMNFGCASSADKRNDQLKHALRNDLYGGYKTVNYSIDSNSVEYSHCFVDLIKDNLKNENGLEDKYILTGLHACGDLTPSAIKIYAKEKCFDTLFIIGCCYNLITDTGFPMSKTVQKRGFDLDKSAKMLACQCPSKWDGTNQVLNKSLLYRAILQKILQDKNIKSDDVCQIKFRRLAKKEISFEKYMEGVRIQCIKLRETLSHDEQERYFKEYKDFWSNMVHFHRLRMQLAPIVENIIHLDRLCFLLENGLKEAAIVQIFDPIISPRCYAIICTKLAT